MLALESDKCPPIAAFCELAVRLYTPSLHNLGAKSPIVSGLHLKYSRFLETRAGDRARSALRGVARSLISAHSTARAARTLIGHVVGLISSPSAPALLLAGGSNQLRRLAIFLNGSLSVFALRRTAKVVRFSTPAIVSTLFALRTSDRSFLSCSGVQGARGVPFISPSPSWPST